MENIYQDVAVEEGIRSVISRYFIREDHCPVCEGEANFVKVVDYQPYWRCMGCMNILKRDFVKAPANTLPEIRKLDWKKEEGTEPDEWEVARARARIRATKIAEAEENKMR